MSEHPSVGKCEGLTKEAVQLEDQRLKNLIDKETTDRINNLVGQFEVRLQNHTERTSREISSVLEVVREVGSHVQQSKRDRETWEAAQDKRQTMFHLKDLRYRKLVKSKLKENREDFASLVKTTEETSAEVKNLKESMAIVRWLVLGTQAIKNTVVGTFSAVENGKKIHMAIASICSFITLVWITAHSIWPTFYYYVVEHHKFSWFK